jgi:hypothetical protein
VIAPVAALMLVPPDAGAATISTLAPLKLPVNTASLASTFTDTAVLYAVSAVSSVALGFAAVHHLLLWMHGVDVGELARARDGAVGTP